VDSLEQIPILATLSRMQSEDDEFSMFALGVDSRDPAGIINLKFDYLEEAIVSNQDSIPDSTYNRIVALLDSAQSKFLDSLPILAAAYVDSIAEVVKAEPDIPHVYYPGEQGHNIAGMIISSAHTLYFSLVGFTDLTGIPDGGEAAQSRLWLAPNPCLASVAIEFECDGRGPIDVSIYSVTGRLVKRLLKQQVPKGRLSLTWHGDSQNGHAVSPGAYFLVVRQGNTLTTKKIVLQR
jgi:hypothetical protein